MKIFQLIFNLSSGGAEKFVVDLSNQLSKMHEVYLCVIQNELDTDLTFFKQQLNENVNYINLKSEKGINGKLFISIFRLIIRLKPDIVNAHLNTVLYLYLPSVLLGRKIKFFHTLHSIAPKTIGFKLQRSINGFLYRKKVIEAIAISTENKNSFAEFFGHTNVSIIENGVVNPSKTEDFEIVKEKLRKLKKSDSDKIFIHIGRFSQPKNQKLLINVFNKILENTTDIILIVIGDYFDSHDAKEIRDISNSKVHYLGKKKNVIDYLLNSDCFVLSSLWEGLPISLLEALSCGIIPVCTPAGGIPDVIKDETLGYLAKDFSEEGLREAVFKCIGNIEKFDRSNLVNNFVNCYSIEICAKKYITLYNK